MVHQNDAMNEHGWPDQPTVPEQSNQCGRCDQNRYPDPQPPESRRIGTLHKGFEFFAGKLPLCQCLGKGGDNCVGHDDPRSKQARVRFVLPVPASETGVLRTMADCIEPFGFMSVQLPLNM